MRSLATIRVLLILAVSYYISAHSVHAQQMGIGSVDRGVAQNASLNSGKSAVFAPQRRLLGTVKTEDGKLVFASKFGNRIWTVVNPEVLKGLEGENVQVFAQMYQESNSMRVLHVRTFKARGQETPLK